MVTQQCEFPYRNSENKEYMIYMNKYLSVCIQISDTVWKNKLLNESITKKEKYPNNRHCQFTGTGTFPFRAEHMGS